MDGPSAIPGMSELEEAYSRLLHRHSDSVSPEDLGVFSQWSRFDPRLAETWISYLAREWHGLNPIELRNSLLKRRWPAAAAVLLEFAEKIVAANPAASDPALFRFWRRTVTEGFPKGNWEQFFIGLRRLGGQSMQDDARFAFSEYRKWGYLGREILLSKSGHSGEMSSRVPTHSLPPETRAEILKSLLSASPRITTDLYWHALGKCISRRQAERDLENSSLVKPHGNTKGRYFLKRAPPATSSNRPRRPARDP